MKEKWVVMMRPEDPLAEKESITPKELSKLPICLVKRPRVKNELASWFGDYFKNLHIQFTSNMSTNAAIMVRNGLTYALVLEGSLPFWNTDQIC